MNKKTKQIIASMIIATSMGILMTGCSISNPMKSAPKSEGVTWVETLDGKKVDMKVSAPPKKSCFHVLCYHRNDACFRLTRSDGRYSFQRR